MKRNLLKGMLVAAALTMGMGAWAWDGNPVAEGTFYLYNVGAGQWLCGANSWGTHASLTEMGGIDVKLAASATGEGLYTIDTQISNGGDNHFLNGEWTDGSAADWAFEEESGAYLMKTGDQYLAYDGQTSNLILTAETGANAQWLLVTREDRIAAMDGASENNPVDVTFLLQCPNFGRNDLRFSSAWKGSPTRGGLNENMCSEKFNCTFDVYQEVKDVPQGQYKLEFQGFYRYGGHGIAPAGDARAAGTEVLNAVLYANQSEAPLMSILDEEVPSLQQPAEGIGVAEYGGVNYPNNMNAASQAFLDGYYNTEMVFTATTNEIRIGVKKTEAVTNDWTIFDNCRLTYLGGLDVSVYKDAYEKALEAANAALNDEAYAAVVGSERDDLAEAINSLGNVSGSQDAYSEAQQALDEATKKFTDAKAAYDAYAVAQELSADAYQYAAAEKVNAYTQAIQAEPTSAKDATEKKDAIVMALRAVAESHALAEGYDGATDITAAIINPNAEEEEALAGWALILGEGSEGSLGVLSNEPLTDASGNSEYKYFDGGNWGAQSWDVSLAQEITLPDGKYMLTVSARAAEALSSYRLYAGDQEVELQHIGAGVDSGLFGRGWNDASVEFELDSEQTVEIGVQGVTETQYCWMSFTRFRLVQFSGSTVGIAEVKSAEQKTQGIFNLQGQRVSAPVKGLYIINGKKVLK